MSDNDNSVEQNFNDSELQDIMNEIESLEKEFIEQEASEESSAEVKMDNVQAEEVHEPQGSEVEEPVAQEQQQQEQEEVAEEAMAEMDDADESAEMEDFSNELDEIEDNIVAMEQPTQPASVPTGEMSFSGHGQMDFNMNFSLGGQDAQLVVEEGKLKVMVAGVELYLSEKGCEVEMNGGVHFSIPFDESGNSAGKKAS